MASSSEGLGLGFGSEDVDPSIAMTTDVELLKRAWRNEKAAPEILQFQHELVQRSSEQVQLMEETVEDFEQNGADPLTVSVYQMDLDRMQFLLRSYLRIRLQKIVKYMIHISKSEAWSRLSEQEQKFSKRCMDDMEKHLNQSVLSRLPYGYQSILKQSISSEEDDMVPQPHLDTYVFCKSRTPLGALQIADGEDPMDVLADFLYLFHYKSIRSFVESGHVDLF
ncbi:hypothetical protein Sjap_006982 [Stephania japonica]|uniref:DNA replication complex GINS protein SLD5 n=1 Tax=Stephania japonica TaxID=461633 RepID=A0AAP0K8P7_9MAGN